MSYTKQLNMYNSYIDGTGTDYTSIIPVGMADKLSIHVTGWSEDATSVAECYVQAGFRADGSDMSEVMTATTTETKVLELQIKSSTNNPPTDPPDYAAANLTDYCVFPYVRLRIKTTSSANVNLIINAFIRSDYQQKGA